MSREFSERTYSAFISYRHAPVDTAVAKEVQFRLEHYHLPKDVREQTGITTLAPIFRDEDELAITPELTKSIAVALKNSAALIVICSPRTSESTWVLKEINEFLSTHDRSRVFVVMAEGTADEVIPEVLLHRVNDDGEVVACDPLAANFRQDCKGQDRANEVTRLAAGLLGMSYDSLAQRALRERTRRRRIIAAVVFGLLLAFTLYTINMNLRIFRNYQEALRRRSAFLAGQATEMVDEGNTIAAMELALAALPADGSWDELFRPVVPEAVLALQRATNAGTLVADGMTSFGTSEVYTTDAEVAHLNISPEEHYLVAADDTGAVTFWEVGKNAPIFSGRSALGRYNNLSHCFALDAGKLLLAYSDGVVCRGTNGEVLWDYALAHDEDHAASICEVAYDKETQSRLVVATDRSVLILDVETGKLLYEYTYSEILGHEVAGVMWFSRKNSDSRGSTVVLSFLEDTDTNQFICDVVTIDTQTGEALAFPAGTHACDRIGLLSDGSIAMLFSDDVGAMTSQRYENTTMVYTETSSSPYHIALYDSATGAAQWDKRVDSWQVCEDRCFAEMVDSASGRPLLACWFADCVLFVDLESGETLNELRVPVSIVSACADVEGQLLLGVLRDGSRFEVSPVNTSVISYGLRRGSLSKAKMMPTGDLYTASEGENVVSVFRGMSGDENLVMSDADLTFTERTFPTKDGFLLLQSDYLEDEDYRRVSKLILLDGASLKAAWEMPLDRGDDLEWDLITYDDAENAVILMGSTFIEDALVPRSIVKVWLEDGREEQYPVKTCGEAKLYVPSEGMGNSTQVDDVVIHGDPVYVGGKLYSQVRDAAGTVGIAVASLSDKTTSCYRVVEGFGSREDATGRRLVLKVDPTGRYVAYQDILGARADEDRTKVHRAGVLDVEKCSNTELSRKSASSLILSDEMQVMDLFAWAEDGSCLAYACEDGVAVYATAPAKRRELRGWPKAQGATRQIAEPDTQNGEATEGLVANTESSSRVQVGQGDEALVVLDSNVVQTIGIVGDKLMVGGSSGANLRAVAYSLENGRRIGACTTGDGFYWSSGFRALKDENVEGGSGDLVAFSTSCCYLIDMESMQLCQVYSNGICYNPYLDTILCCYEEQYYATKRYSLEELMVRGREMLGDNTMGEEWLGDHGV